jgi:TRAP transporter TAXI family solute receptor
MSKSGIRPAIRIGTSEAHGTFHTQGLAIAEVARAAGAGGAIEIVTSPSASVDNARKLDAGAIELGFMASNWIGRAHDGVAPFERPVALRMASPVNVGPLFFIALAGSALETVSDLAGKRVAIGLEDSGMVQHVHTMFAVLGILFEDFTPVHLGFADGAAALEAGEVDAQFQCPIPNQVMTDLSARADIRVLGHEPAALDRLIGAVPFYRRVTMAKGALPGMEADIDQVGVLNVLATHERVAPGTVAEVVAAMVAGAAELARLNPLYAGLDGLYEPLRTLGEAAFEIGGVGLHPGAAKAYRDAGLLARDGMAG